MFRIRILAVMATVTALAAITLVTAASAASPPDLPGVVSQTQATWTPQVDVGSYDDKLQVSDLAPGQNGVMYACGLFSGVTTVVDGLHHSVQNVFAYYTSGANQGKLTGFAPKVNGPIDTCLVTPDQKSLLICGSFSSAGGQPESNVAKVDLSTGALEPFASTNGRVSDCWYGHGLFWLTGEFTTVDGHAQTGIATVHAGGKFSGYFRSKLSGTISARAGSTKAYRGVITTNGKHMVAIVNSSTIDGQPRQQVANWDLGAKHATLRDWILRKSLPSDGPCTLMAGRGIAAIPGSPNDVILSSTGGPNNGICDQTMRVSTAKTGLVGVKWTNYTDGDTSHAVVATSGAIYTQGHMKSCALLAGGRAHTKRTYVDRIGICALDPKTGNLITSWRSDQSKAVGGEGLTVTNQAGFPTGLWSAIDFHDAAGSGIIFRSQP